MSPDFRATLLAMSSGVLLAAYATIALFFTRFWRRSGDRLFAWFSACFWLLAAQRLALVLTGEWGERSVMVYGLRLLAFLFIVVAIVEKNRGRPVGRRA